MLRSGVHLVFLLILLRLTDFPIEFIYKTRLAILRQILIALFCIPVILLATFGDKNQFDHALLYVLTMHSYSPPLLNVFLG